MEGTKTSDSGVVIESELIGTDTGGTMRGTKLTFDEDVEFTGLLISMAAAGGVPKVKIFVGVVSVVCCNKEIVSLLMVGSVETNDLSPINNISRFGGNEDSMIDKEILNFSSTDRTVGRALDTGERELKS